MLIARTLLLVRTSLKSNTDSQSCLDPLSIKKQFAHHIQEESSFVS